jgi:hypothetical protein
MSKNIKKDPHAVSLGRKGGNSRAKSLSSEQRRAIASAAAKARWAKKKEQ